jgi:hypothetical protein
MQKIHQNSDKPDPGAKESKYYDGNIKIPSQILLESFLRMFRECKK